jgi:hypothetical protein
LLAVSLPVSAQSPPAATTTTTSGAPSTPGSAARASDQIFTPGEELIYNVSYTGVNLGQVRIRLLGSSGSGDSAVYRAQANIDSYEGIPFVDLHALYDDSIGSGIYSSWFKSRRKENGGWDTVVYTYDYPRRVMTIDSSPDEGEKGWQKDSLVLDTRYQDGLSLLYYARRNVSTKQNVTVPVIVNEEKGTADFEFEAKREEVEIDAVDYPVDALYLNGEAGFVGIYGLTGGFEGWFSNDAARVPIVGKMKVIIGSVRLELMKWKRPGWSPPEYKEAD